MVEEHRLLGSRAGRTRKERDGMETGRGRAGSREMVKRRGIGEREGRDGVGRDRSGVVLSLIQWNGKIGT